LSGFEFAAKRAIPAQFESLFMQDLDMWRSNRLIMSKMSRREFNRVITASAVSVSLGITSQAQEPKQENGFSEQAFAMIRASGAHIPSEAEAKVKTALNAMQSTLKSLRDYSLPEGSEPSFAFRSLPVKRQ